MGGLATDQTYHVRVVDNKSFELFSNSALTSKVDLTNTGAGHEHQFMLDLNKKTFNVTADVNVDPADDAITMPSGVRRRNVEWPT